MSNEHNSVHSQDQCNACLGTGRMVRDPDIGTDQECFVCDGAGYEPAQEMTLTDEEIDAIASKYMSTVGDHWCNEEAIRERHAEDFARAIIAALRAKGAV